ncbi:MAG: hypothetical protein CMJ18_11335 [Phycisphaeraceae bacterium]|nr:hypothetical protein [Phycisphaeraceae bacterium]
MKPELEPTSTGILARLEPNEHAMSQWERSLWDEDGRISLPGLAQASEVLQPQDRDAFHAAMFEMICDLQSEGLSRTRITQRFLFELRSYVKNHENLEGDGNCVALAPAERSGGRHRYEMTGLDPEEHGEPHVFVLRAGQEADTIEGTEDPDAGRVAAAVRDLASTPKRKEGAPTNFDHGFEAMVNRNKPPISKFFWIRIGNLADVDDLTQEVFIRAFQAMRNDRYVDCGRERQWLFAIARNCLLDHVIAQQRDAQFRETLQTAETMPADARSMRHDPSVITEDQERNERLRVCINELREDLQDLIEQKFVFRFSINRIAENLEIKPNTVKSRLHRALRNIGKCYRAETA